MNNKLLLPAAWLLFLILYGYLTHAQVSGFDIPSEIKVFIPATYDKCKSWKGSIETINLKDYVKNVLTNEWAPTSEFSLEALKAGAVAIKTYAIYLIWYPKTEIYIKKGINVRADACDQVYRPGRAIPPLVNQAVDETWEWILTRNNTIISSLYIDGSKGSPNLYSAANNKCYPGRMSQWGSEYWADQGKDWQWILHYYYNPINIISINSKTSLPTPNISTAPPTCDKPQKLNSCKTLKSPTLFRIKGDPIKVYWYQNKRYYHVLDRNVLNAMNGMPGWSWDQICEASLKKLKKASPGPEFIAPDNRSEGVLIRQQGTNEVYRVESGRLRYISYQECVQMNCWDDIINVTPTIMALFPQVSGSSPTPTPTPVCPPGTTGTPPNCQPITPPTPPLPNPSQNFTLIVNVFGNGSVISVTDEGIECGSDCQQDYPSGTTVVLLAMPAPGAVFRGWSIAGCDTNLCTITMVFPVTVSAIFNEGSSPPMPPPSPPPSTPLPNQPPWAQIEVFPRTVNVGEFVTIQVISYGDPEGQPLAFDYDFGDGTVISSPAAGERHRYSQPGTYTVRAKVRDPQGAFSYTNSVSVTVIGPSSPPPSLPLIDSDDDGIPDNQDQCPYAWGPPPLGCPATAQPPSPPTRQSPIAQFVMSADGQTAFENEILWLEVLAGTTVTVRFSAGRSFDPDGTIVSYQWFINGTPVSRSRDFSFDLGANAPQHLIHLIITDNDGQKAEVGATIIVEEIIGLDDPPWLFGLKNNIGFTSVQVYSVQGKLIYQFEEIPPHRLWQWDMKDQYGTRVPNGVYLAVITIHDLSGYPIRREVKKIVVLR